MRVNKIPEMALSGFIGGMHDRKPINEIPETMVSGFIDGMHNGKPINEIPEKMVSGFFLVVCMIGNQLMRFPGQW